MITGSIASSLQGEPRSTHDIDLVIAIREEDINRIVASFPSPAYYLDRESVVRAVENRKSFNVIVQSESTKLDFWLLTDDPFDRSRFSRKYAEHFAGSKVYVSRREDTILAKLRWSKLSGGSEKQFADALRVYEV
ncbi:MAG: hypothetical protein V2A74_09160 [bacterium]